MNEAHSQFTNTNNNNKSKRELFPHCVSTVVAVLLLELHRMLSIVLEKVFFASFHQLNELLAVYQSRDRIKYVWKSCVCMCVCGFIQFDVVYMAFARWIYVQHLTKLLFILYWILSIHTRTPMLQTICGRFEQYQQKSGGFFVPLAAIETQLFGKQMKIDFLIDHCHMVVTISQCTRMSRSVCATTL